MFVIFILQFLLTSRVGRILHHGSCLFPSLKIFEEIVHLLNKSLTIGGHLARLHYLLLQGFLLPHKVLILVEPCHEIFLLLLWRLRDYRRHILLIWWRQFLLFTFFLLTHTYNALSEISVFGVLEKSGLIAGRWQRLGHILLLLLQVLLEGLHRCLLL